MPVFHRYAAVLVRFGCALLLLVPTLIGCTSDEEEQTTVNPFENLQLRIAVPEDLDLTQHWQILLDEWSAQTGATCEIVEYTVEPANSTLAKALIAGGNDDEGEKEDAGKRLADVHLMIFPLTEVPELVANDVLAQIPNEQRTALNLDWFDVFPGIRDSVASPGRKPSLVPLNVPVPVCYYRKDLLVAAGLKPPRTWDEYQKLLDTLGNWADGLTAVEPWNDAYRATTYLARSLAFTKHTGHYSVFFDIDTGESLINTAGFVKSLETVQRALPTLSPDVLDYGPAECRREILEGRAALGIAFETGPGNPALPFDPEFAIGGTSPADRETLGVAARAANIQIGICRLPGAGQVFNRSSNSWEAAREGDVNYSDLTAFAGLGAGVSRKAGMHHQQAAWNLLAELTIDQLPAAFPGATKSVCRESQVPQAAAWLGDELTAAERQQYLSVVANSLRSKGLVSELPVVSRRRFRAALSQGIGRVLHGQAEPAEALADVHHEWTTIAGEVGQEQVRDSYRANLGLPIVKALP